MEKLIFDEFGIEGFLLLFPQMLHTHMLVFLGLRIDNEPKEGQKLNLLMQNMLHFVINRGVVRSGHFLNGIFEDKVPLIVDRLQIPVEPPSILDEHHHHLSELQGSMAGVLQHGLG